jgi:Na+/glutamate symporter
MDGFSLIVGGIFGILAGWAFSNATVKQQEATRKLQKASQAAQEMSQKKGEARINKESSLSDTVQGIFFYVLGFCIVIGMGVILFASAG